MSGSTQTVKVQILKKTTFGFSTVTEPRQKIRFMTETQYNRTNWRRDLFANAR